MGASAGRLPRRNPLSRTYQTADGRTLWFTCLQAGKYWPTLCAAIGRPELATDPRFADHASLHGQQRRGHRVLNAVFAGATLDEWRQRLAGFDGQWAVMQDTIEAAADPQTVANGYVQDCRTAAGIPFRLAAAPVQFDGEPAAPARAPSSTSTATASSKSSGSTGTPSWTSRYAAWLPDISHTSTPRKEMTMTLFDAFRYDGKRALVVGGATGMGAAAAELLQSAGADVVVMDFAEDLATGGQRHPRQPRRARLDRRGTSTSVGGPVDALLSCAGVADGTPGIEKINFIGHRHLIDRLLAKDLLPRGSAIGFISSAAGLGWEANLPRIQEYLATPDFDSAVEWVADQRRRRLPVDQAGDLRLRGHPGIPHDEARDPDQCHLPRARPTPRWPRPTRRCGSASAPTTAARLGVEASTPLEQAYPLVFLCSQAAVCDQRDHPGHRLGLLRRRRHRGVPGRHAGGQISAGAAGVTSPAVR